jgi:regulator of replication initiation timing
MNYFEKNMYQEIRMLREKFSILKLENAKLREQLRWRSVSEPPKENVDVEVCDMSKSSLDEREPVIAYYEKGKWVCVFPYNYDVYAYITPTHWRYIPPAPEVI